MKESLSQQSARPSRGRLANSSCPPLTPNTDKASGQEHGRCLLRASACYAKIITGTKGNESGLYLLQRKKHGGIAEARPCRSGQYRGCWEEVFKRDCGEAVDVSVRGGHGRCEIVEEILRTQDLKIRKHLV
ncbi:hypothetical protein E2C01_015079 [Portunus trituberculatus]|uniref:Uncharacterized protein n=1 Tax=Portunus trituberculatus TaxID=210409 RepID=A0A5B7DLV2_PORTR|nr:hypothetical protein [Portunus trituberculatus]